MKRHTMVVVICMLIGVIWAGGAWGQALPPEVMSTLQDVEILQIKKNNVDVIWDLRPTEHPQRADIVDLRLEYAELSSELTTVLQEWVRSGKGIILYRTNIHRFLPEIDIAPNWEPLGDVVNAIEDSHPVMTGVEKVEFGTGSFRPPRRGPQSSYTAIMEGVDGKIAAIVSSYGRGRLVAFFNSDNWSDASWKYSTYDNERFRINLEQWLAGAPVPGAMGVGPVAGGRTTEVSLQLPEVLHDTIYLKNGDVLSGIVLNEKFNIVASYGPLAFPISDIAQILLEGVVQQGPGNIEQIILRIGDKISGVVQEEKVDVKLASGPEISLEKDKIASITFKVR